MSHLTITEHTLLKNVVLCVLLCIFICFSSCGDASRFSFGDIGNNHLSVLVQSLDGINNVGENEIMMKAPKHGGNTLSSIFDVRQYGAKGDGIRDDTKAFQAAWKAACEANNGIMLVPSRYRFLVQSITFNGNKCQSNIMFQVNGEIVAPMRSAWKEIDEQWILFTGLKKGLTIKGNGIIDGRGEGWWKYAKSNEESRLPFNGEENRKTKSGRPHAIMIEKSNNVTVNGVTMRNSPQMHLFFSYCQHVTILNFTISSPEESPNTDGIHLSHTQDVKIRHATLACGDDCISIQNGCSNVKIYNVHCGPGHGFSIGSLGYKGGKAYVYDIGVYDSTATGTTNGVRIKTWVSATGSARKITFDNIIMSNVKNPIIVDQHYCNGHEFCDSYGKVDDSVFSISGITYNNIRGTYTKRSVALVCSKHTPCRDIAMSNINLNPSSSSSKGNGIEKSYCSNVYGKVLTNTKPSLDNCILSDKASALGSNGRYGIQ